MKVKLSCFGVHFYANSCWERCFTKEDPSLKVSLKILLPSLWRKLEIEFILTWWEKRLLNFMPNDLHFFTLFFSVSSLSLHHVWLKTFILAVFSLSPRLIDAPLSFVENPRMSTSWFLHSFWSEFDATGKQTGWTFRPKSIEGSTVQD